MLCSRQGFTVALEPVLKLASNSQSSLLTAGIKVLRHHFLTKKCSSWAGTLAQWLKVCVTKSHDLLLSRDHVVENQLPQAVLCPMCTISIFNSLSFQSEQVFSLAMEQFSLEIIEKIPPAILSST